MNWEFLRMDKALGLLGKKKSTCFILHSESWHLFPFWKISWDWSSRSCIFNAFSSSGPYLTLRPPFSLRCWFNMISALYRNETSVNKAREPAEALSSASTAPGGCLQSSGLWWLLVLETYLFFFFSPSVHSVIKKHFIQDLRPGWFVSIWLISAAQTLVLRAGLLFPEEQNSAWSD